MMSSRKEKKKNDYCYWLPLDPSDSEADGDSEVEVVNDDLEYDTEISDDDNDEQDVEFDSEEECNDIEDKEWGSNVNDFTTPLNFEQEPELLIKNEQK